jgi:hypothetical protein
MSKLNQKNAVYLAVVNALADAGISFDDGQSPSASELLTKENRANVVAVITQGFLSDEIEMTPEGKAKYDTESKLKSYVSGLTSNWLRKDKRLNGGVDYEAKNPGSRAGSSDPMIKALNMAKKIKADDAEALAAINEEIAKRKAEIGATKKVELTAEQIALLPEELRSKLGV